MAEVEYKKGEYSSTYHGSLRSLLNEIEKDLKTGMKSRAVMDYQLSRIYDAKKEAVIYTITSIKDIEHLLQRIYSFPTRLQTRYYKVISLLTEERTRLLDLLFMEINGFSSFRYQTGAKRALISAKRVFANYDKSYAEISSNKANNEIDKKKKDKKHSSDIYIGELDSLEELIQDLDYLLSTADKTNPIKEEVKEEVGAIKRVFPPRVISTSKEVVSKLEQLEERKIVLDYLELLEVPFSRVDRDHTRAFKRKAKDIPFDERRVFLGNTKTSRVFKKVEKLLRKIYLELSKEQERTEKEKDDLSYKRMVIGRGLNESTSALKNYKFSLINNEDAIKAQKRVAELERKKEETESDIRRLKNGISYPASYFQSESLYQKEFELDFINGEIKRKSQIKPNTTIDPKYKNMEEKLENVKKL